MANLFEVVVQTNTTRSVNVAAASAEEAQAKIVVAEGETVVNIVDKGELVA